MTGKQNIEAAKRAILNGRLGHDQTEVLLKIAEGVEALNERVDSLETVIVSQISSLTQRIEKLIGER